MGVFRFKGYEAIGQALYLRSVQGCVELMRKIHHLQHSRVNK